MAARLVTAAIVAFWAAMMALLWRDEAGLGRHAGEPVPMDVVATRILSAADSSQLRLVRGPESLGVLRWMPSVLEEAPAAASDVPEGMIERLGGYRLDVDLNLAGESPDRRWRLLGQVDFGTNRQWREIHVKLIQRPVAFELVARAGEDAVTVRFEEGRRAPVEQRVPTKDLLQVPALLGASARILPFGLGGAAGTTGGTAGAGEFEWTARNDVLRVGRFPVRTYRVSARVLGRQEIAAHFSRAGELLRVDLPDRYALVGEAFGVTNR